MSTPLFDVQCGFGGANPGETRQVSADACLRMLAQLQVQRALVRTEPDGPVIDAPMANEELFAACAGHPELVPCPILVPATGGDLPPETEQVDAFIRRGARAVVIRPGPDNWQFLPFVYDRLMCALVERRLPLVCLERYAGPAQVAELAAKYPDLPLVHANVGYRALRTQVPLLQSYCNVYLSLGNNFTAHAGIEHLVRLVGPDRLLFGTGFPASEPMMAVTQLMYAQITEAQKTMIGAGNAERLVAAVKL